MPVSRVVLVGILAAPLVVMAACGGAETEIDGASNDAGGEVDSAAALPPGVDHYHGNVACCAQDAGLCCSGDVQLCEAYVACDQAGEAWEPKGLYCEECCPGLTALEVVRQNADGTCDRDAGLELEPDFVCAACGNGVCEKTSGENHCSCPADCP